MTNKSGYRIDIYLHTKARKLPQESALAFCIDEKAFEKYQFSNAFCDGMNH